MGARNIDHRQAAARERLRGVGRRQRQRSKRTMLWVLYWIAIGLFCIGVMEFVSHFYRSGGTILPPPDHTTPAGQGRQP